MNHHQTIEIKFAVIRDAVLRIASEKPEWFYTEGWLKEILSTIPSNQRPRQSISPDIKNFDDLIEDIPF